MALTGSRALFLNLAYVQQANLSQGPYLLLVNYYMAMHNYMNNKHNIICAKTSHVL